MTGPARTAWIRGTVGGAPTARPIRFPRTGLRMAEAFPGYEVPDPLAGWTIGEPLWPVIVQHTPGVLPNHFDALGQPVYVAPTQEL